VDVEARAIWFWQATFESPAMFRRQAGGGSVYWFSARDKTGAFVDGRKLYKLTIPQPVPATLFWSVTVYDPRHPFRNPDRPGQGGTAVAG
jgi:hypothetical protein